MAHQSADKGAFEGQFVELIPHLRAFARMLARDPAYGDDLAQEALARAWASQARFAPGTNLKAWLFTILRNQFYSDRRRNWRVAPLDPTDAEKIIAGGSTDRALELDELRRAMAMLTDEQREALVLVGAAGLSYEETAEIIGVAVGTIKSRVSRARDHLALIYAEGSIDKDGILPSAAMAFIGLQIESYRHAHR